MVVIVNYDLYIRINGSWQLHGRYSSDQKEKVFSDAKGVEENQFYPVKIIKENFNADTADSSESVVYMSKNTFDSKKDEIKRKKAEKAKRKKKIKNNKEEKKAQNIVTKRAEKNKKGHDEFLTVGVKLLILIIVSILIAKAVLWVIDPALMIIFKGDDLYNAKFFAFFIIFLGFAIPLILKNISWNVDKKIKTVTKQKATIHVASQNLSENDLDDGIATPFEAVPIDYTKQTIAVLDKFVSALKDIKAPINQFSKFGVKLAIYGACKFIKEKEDLSQAQLNTLLHDSFSILDTDEVNTVANFLESKSTYENIDLAKTMIRAGEAVVANIHSYDKTEFDKIANIMKSWQNVAEKANIPSQQTEKSAENQAEEIQASPLYAESESLILEDQNESFSDDDDYEAMENLNDEEGDYDYDLSSFMEDNSPQKQKEIEEKSNDHEVVTVLFSDIVNSTVLNEEYGDDAAFELLEKHNKIYRKTLLDFGGREIKHTGDGIMSSFNSVNKAAEAAVEMQKEFFKYNKLQSTNPKLDVRIGLNTGEPVKSNNDLFGSTVQVASRCCDMAKGGEILATSVVKGLLTGKKIKLESIGSKKLKGLSEPVALYKILFTPDFVFEDEDSGKNNQDKNFDEDLVKAGVF